MNQFIKKIFSPLIASLTLGLAPFAPEPHFFGKIRWIIGGAVGMQMMDWWDLIMHGAPWVWLIYSIVTYFISAKKVN